ncbi:MAG: redoxin domain-containing protein [Deltaproteobacteria bacterium]|nr:redoxin domain-containing protein [Deltaproteobacteria bacterium]MBW2499820.1 redoxin domain-containing protein [Deltaproteobacteria bacterium]
MDAFETAGCSVLGASFDTVEEQKTFAETEGFPYPLLSDPEKTMGAAYDAVRQPGEKYAEAGIPRRISYLINPEGKIAKAYDVEVDGLDLDGHAAAILADIKALG